ncbi:MAG: AAA family ATPase [Clostridia bacterium]|nr:AAA family ATPase [Clostridia bacterium]
MNIPKLILLCGIPGSGKTTYAQKYIKEHGGIHLSSDLIRKELYGDESIQGNPHEVFSLMQSIAVDVLNDGKNVVYDATNVTRKDRSGIIVLCPEFVQIECHIAWAPIETCIERDTSRERTVGKEVIDKMLKRFQPPFYDEGINEIKVVFTSNFDESRYVERAFNAMQISHNNPHHTLNIYDHCMEAYNYAIGLGVKDELTIAALLHDIGKPYVKSFEDSKGNVGEVAHYYSHQNVSAYMAYGIHNATPYVVWLVGVHMEPFFDSKYYKKLPEFLKRDVDALHECDVNAH